MQIHLKQLEIEAALKMFVAQQGINLTGKTIEIAFTSGRKDNGLSAEITIEDQAGYVAPVAVAPVSLNNPFIAYAAAAEVKPVVPAVTPAEPTVEEPAVVKPISLFSQ